MNHTDVIPFELSPAFAGEMDRQDPLSRFRKSFVFPQHQGRDVVYMTGNSLGLQPRDAGKYLNEALEAWARYGVEGHVTGNHPWLPYHEFFTESLARIVGAKPSEVVCMGSLTTNLHLLMVSFFRPNGRRKKILCEAKAFPSDRYALMSQLRFHGLNPETDLIEIAPRPDEHTIHPEDVFQIIREQGDQIAMLMMGGVNYYTGQVFPMQSITKAARDAGITVGWDLAHGAGNIPLELHDWDADFAAWCSYKYLNAGPGGVAGIFIHERHHGKKDLPRFEGWWGHQKDTRFAMPPDFNPIPNAEAWQLSNAPVFSMAPLRASLDVFDATNMQALRTKTLQLSGYLEFVLKTVSAEAHADFQIITPENWEARGCQISVLTGDHGKSLFNHLTDHGVIADWREPNVIRLAPAPLYCSFDDIYRFGIILKQALNHG
jgi:kynureninase